MSESTTPAPTGDPWGDRPTRRISTLGRLDPFALDQLPAGSLVVTSIARLGRVTFRRGRGSGSRCWLATPGQGFTADELATQPGAVAREGDAR